MTRSKLALNSTRKTIATLLIVSLTALIAPSSIAAPALRYTPGHLQDLLGHFGSWISALARPRSNSVDKRTRKDHAATFRSREEKEAGVAEIRMNCADCTSIHVQEPIQFIGVPVDNRGDAINGLGVRWLSSNDDVLDIDDEGRANPKKPGKVTLSASTQNRTKSIHLTVLKPRKQRSSSSKSNRSTDSTHHPNAAFSWDISETERQALYTTENIVGAPEGKISPLGVGESSAGTTETGVSNFMFSSEVVSLPGRGGLNAALSLVLNSQVWTKTYNFIGNPIHRYDVDSGWPAPGFRLGFGQIEKVGNAPQPTYLALTDPDGTRHSMKVTTTNNYDSEDGSFIHYTMVTGGGTAFYTDGTQVTYGAAGSGNDLPPKSAHWLIQLLQTSKWLMV